MATTPTVQPKTATQDRWEKSVGFIYFIGAQQPPIAIKIGISMRSDIRRRFRTIQGANHEPLYLLGVIYFGEGDRPMLSAEARERVLHVQFAHLQLFAKGWAGSEWFRPAQDLLEFISANAVAPESYSLEVSIAKPGPGRLGAV